MAFTIFKFKNPLIQVATNNNAGKIFGKIMAGMLLIFMVAGTFATLIFALQ